MLSENILNFYNLAIKRSYLSYITYLIEYEKRDEKN